MDMAEPTAPHIAIVDDDEKIRRLLRRCFEPEGYRVSEAANAAELDAIMADDPVDLITLDLNLAGDDGLSIARTVRTRSQVPIIMVTGKGDPIDKIVGLEVGADDYISKPFHVREVLARVRSVLRRATAQAQAQAPAEEHRSPPAAHGVYRFGDWAMDIPKRELRLASGGMETLTTGEFDLLEVLVKNPNRVLSRDKIMDSLKGHDWNPYDRSIDNQVARLRKKIEADPNNPQLIKTVRGVGYTFTADVTGG
jgi:DNA-binding response OmpR family regulator